MTEKIRFEDSLKAVIDALVIAVDKEAIEENQEAFERLGILYEQYEPSRFWSAVQIGQHKFERILSAMMKVPPQKNQYIVEHIISGLYEHYWKKYFDKIEGSACCADKARFVREMSLRALQENNNLSLYDDYMNCDNIKENKEEQAYWSPKTIPDTDTAMSMFWNWYLIRD